MVVFSIVGGFCCGIIDILVPCMEYLGFLKLEIDNQDSGSFKSIAYKVVSIFLFASGTLGSILSTIGVA
jgi:hypothetical protein